MATNECEKVCRTPKFNELDQKEQIEKLRYELRVAMRAISHIGNKVTLITNHEHGAKGEVLVSPERVGRAFQPDRSDFLD